MRIFLTGGAGDLGHVLAHQLVLRGDLPVRFDIRQPARPLGQYLAGSVLDRDTLRQSVRGCDCIVHIAGWHGIHEVTGQKNADDFWDLNVTGTYNVFEAAARAEVGRVVYISSTSIADWAGVYGHTKVLGETIARTYAARHGMRVITLRPSAFIPYWNQATYTSYLDWAAWFWKGAVHIDDVAQAVIPAIDTLAAEPPSEPLVLNVDGAYDYTGEDLRSWDADGPGSTFRKYYADYYDLAVRYGLDPATKPQTYDISETTARLGYRPTYGARQLLRELADYGAAGPPWPDSLLQN
jgi:nucleoside-diphosphate-sugar epimerase